MIARERPFIIITCFTGLLAVHLFRSSGILWPAWFPFFTWYITEFSCRLRIVADRRAFFSVEKKMSYLFYSRTRSIHDTVDVGMAAVATVAIF